MTDTDDGTLAVVRDRLAEARDALGGLPPGPPVTAVLQRARRRRAGRWLAAAGGTATAAGLAVAVAYSAQTPPQPGQAQPPAPGHEPAPVHVHLAAAWSVDTNADGTVTFRLRDTSDPSRLQKALRQATVPAVVRFGQICLAPGRGAVPKGALAGPGQHTGPKMQSVITANGTGGGKLLSLTWTISPAKIPSGTRLVISAVRPAAAPAGTVRAAWEFVPAGAPLGCTSTPPKLGS
jgi:hypothetical protein